MSYIEGSKEKYGLSLYEYPAIVIPGTDTTKAFNREVALQGVPTQAPDKSLLDRMMVVLDWWSKGVVPSMFVRYEKAAGFAIPEIQKKDWKDFDRFWGDVSTHAYKMSDLRMLEPFGRMAYAVGESGLASLIRDEAVQAVINGKLYTPSPDEAAKAALAWGIFSEESKSGQWRKDPKYQAIVNLPAEIVVDLANPLFFAAEIGIKGLKIGLNRSFWKSAYETLKGGTVEQVAMFLTTKVEGAPVVQSSLVELFHRMAQQGNADDFVALGLASGGTRKTILSDIQARIPFIRYFKTTNQAVNPLLLEYQMRDRQISQMLTQQLDEALGVNAEFQEALKALNKDELVAFYNIVGSPQALEKWKLNKVVDATGFVETPSLKRAVDAQVKVANYDIGERAKTWLEYRGHLTDKMQGIINAHTEDLTDLKIVFDDLSSQLQNAPEDVAVKIEGQLEEIVARARAIKGDIARVEADKIRYLSTDEVPKIENYMAHIRTDDPSVFDPVADVVPIFTEKSYLKHKNGGDPKEFGIDHEELRKRLSEAYEKVSLRNISESADLQWSKFIEDITKAETETKRLASLAPSGSNDRNQLAMIGDGLEDFRDSAIRRLEKIPVAPAGQRSAGDIVNETQKAWDAYHLRVNEAKREMGRAQQVWKTAKSRLDDLDRKIEALEPQVSQAWDAHAKAKEVREAAVKRREDMRVGLKTLRDKTQIELDAAWSKLEREREALRKTKAAKWEDFRADKEKALGKYRPEYEALEKKHSRQWEIHEEEKKALGEKEVGTALQKSAALSEEKSQAFKKMSQLQDAHKKEKRVHFQDKNKALDPWRQRKDKLYKKLDKLKAGQSKLWDEWSNAKAAGDERLKSELMLQIKGLDRPIKSTQGRINRIDKKQITAIERRFQSRLDLIEDTHAIEREAQDKVINAVDKKLRLAQEEVGKARTRVGNTIREKSEALKLAQRKEKLLLNENNSKLRKIYADKAQALEKSLDKADEPLKKRHAELVERGRKAREIFDNEMFQRYTEQAKQADARVKSALDRAKQLSSQLDAMKSPRKSGVNTDFKKRSELQAEVNAAREAFIEKAKLAGLIQGASPEPDQVLKTLDLMVMAYDRSMGMLRRFWLFQYPTRFIAANFIDNTGKSFLSEGTLAAPTVIRATGEPLIAVPQMGNISRWAGSRPLKVADTTLEDVIKGKNASPLRKAVDYLIGPGPLQQLATSETERYSRIIVKGSAYNRKNQELIAAGVTDPKARDAIAFSYAEKEVDRLQFMGFDLSFAGRMIERAFPFSLTFGIPNLKYQASTVVEHPLYFHTLANLRETLGEAGLSSSGEVDFGPFSLNPTNLLATLGFIDLADSIYADASGLRVQRKPLDYSLTPEPGSLSSSPDRLNAVKQLGSLMSMRGAPIRPAPLVKAAYNATMVPITDAEVEQKGLAGAAISNQKNVIRDTFSPFDTFLKAAGYPEGMDGLFWKVDNVHPEDQPIYRKQQIGRIMKAAEMRGEYLTPREAEQAYIKAGQVRALGIMTGIEVAPSNPELDEIKRIQDAYMNLPVEIREKLRQSADPEMDVLKLFPKYKAGENRDQLEKARKATAPELIRQMEEGTPEERKSLLQHFLQKISDALPGVDKQSQASPEDLMQAFSETTPGRLAAIAKPGKASAEEDDTYVSPVPMTPSSDGTQITQADTDALKNLSEQPRALAGFELSPTVPSRARIEDADAKAVFSFRGGAVRKKLLDMAAEEMTEDGVASMWVEASKPKDPQQALEQAKLVLRQNRRDEPAYIGGGIPEGGGGLLLRGEEGPSYRAFSFYKVPDMTGEKENQFAKIMVVQLAERQKQAAASSLVQKFQELEAKGAREDFESLRTNPRYRQFFDKDNPLYLPKMYDRQALLSGSLGKPEQDLSNWIKTGVLEYGVEKRILDGEKGRYPAMDLYRKRLETAVNHNPNLVHRVTSDATAAIENKELPPNWWQSLKTTDPDLYTKAATLDRYPEINLVRGRVFRKVNGQTVAVPVRVMEESLRGGMDELMAIRFWGTQDERNALDNMPKVMGFSVDDLAPLDMSMLSTMVGDSYDLRTGLRTNFLANRLTTTAKVPAFPDDRAPYQNLTRDNISGNYRAAAEIGDTDVPQPSLRDRYISGTNLIPTATEAAGAIRQATVQADFGLDFSKTKIQLPSAPVQQSVPLYPNMPLVPWLASVSRQHKVDVAQARILEKELGYKPGSLEPSFFSTAASMMETDNGLPAVDGYRAASAITSLYNIAGSAGAFKPGSDAAAIGQGMSASVGTAGALMTLGMSNPYTIIPTAIAAGVFAAFSSKRKGPDRKQEFEDMRRAQEAARAERERIEQAARDSQNLRQREQSLAQSFRQGFVPSPELQKRLDNFRARPTFASRLGLVDAVQRELSTALKPRW